MALTNTKNIPLSVAAWLATSSYDFIPNPTKLSATDFNRSVRQIVLRNRITDKNLLAPTDISQLIKSKIGTACHDSIESFWLDPFKREIGLSNLNLGADIIDRIVINVEPEELKKGDIPVYMERRREVEIDGFTISGKFDFVGQGRLTDFKTTGTWKWTKLQDADEDYRTQGSIYRYIHRDVIFDDYMDIVFIFTDWMEGRAKKADITEYPPVQCLTHQVKLMSLEETEAFIRKRIAEIKEHTNNPDLPLPECTQKQLWQSDPVYQYFKNPSSKRATKNFDTLYEAQAMQAKNGMGEIRIKYSEVKACNTCSVASICSQRERLIQSGLLKL